MNLRSGPTRNLRLPRSNGENARTASRNCENTYTSITVIKNKKSHPEAGECPRILRKLWPVYRGITRETEILGQSEEAWPIGVSPSSGKRGMGHELSSKLIGATARIFFFAQGPDVWPDDTADCEGAKRMPLCHRRER